MSFSLLTSAKQRGTKELREEIIFKSLRADQFLTFTQGLSSGKKGCKSHESKPLASKAAAEDQACVAPRQDHLASRSQKDNRSQASKKPKNTNKKIK